MFALSSIKNTCSDTKSHFQHLVGGGGIGTAAVLYWFEIQAPRHTLGVEFIFTGYGKNTQIDTDIGGYSHTGPGPVP